MSTGDVLEVVSEQAGVVERRQGKDLTALRLYPHSSSSSRLPILVPLYSSPLLSSYGSRESGMDQRPGSNRAVIKVVVGGGDRQVVGGIQTPGL